MRCRLSIPLILIVNWITVSGQADDKLMRSLCGAVERDKPYKAIKHYKRNAKEITAEQVALRTCYAHALNMIGDHAGAERVCRGTVIDPTSPANGPLDLQWGIALNGLARYDSAELVLWKAAKAGVADRTSMPLSAALQGQGRWLEAIAMLDRVLEVDTASSRAYRERGASHAAMGDSAAARRDLDKAIELSPRDPVCWNSRGYQRWARFGEHARAIQDYDRAIKLNPNYSYAFNNRGWSYYKSGKTEKALKDIELAGRKFPGNPMVHRNLGVITLETGKVEEACGHLRRALEEGYSAQFGDEVKLLVEKHCATLPEPAAPPPPATNAPGSPPVKSNAP